MSAKLIKAIRVKQLFGLYTYSLPASGELSNSAILYGDNGVGKSTLLRLAFHLLSAADDRGHRGALYSADFERLEVDLSSGVTLTAATSGDKESRILLLEIKKGNEVLAGWDYEPGGSWDRFFSVNDFQYEVRETDGRKIVARQRRSTSKGAENRGNEAYIKVLSIYAPKVFILNAERRLDSDTVSDPSDEMEIRRVMNYKEPKRINELVVRSREIALSQALSAASKWVGKQAILGANQGSTNVHSVYVDVLRHILAPSAEGVKSESDQTVGGLVKTLQDIETRMAEHAKYELATELSTSDFRKALRAKSKEKGNLAAELLKPYIRSLESRLEAVEPIYLLLDRFVTVLNGFLTDKSIGFTLSQGFGIRNRLGGSLEPAQLSSGEQQLLLLFCYALTARDFPSVFMIDEPEISLNIKWQRKLIQSLLDVTEGAEIQFVFASHSMELLAQHSEKVVRLVDKS